MDRFHGYARFSTSLDPGLREAHANAWSMLARAGSHWSGAQRVAIARQARSAFAQRNELPFNRAFQDPPELSTVATLAARKVAADAGKIDRDWASENIESMGDAAYVELVAIVATVCSIDGFAEALGINPEPFPEPEPGEPDGFRHADAVEAGAYVPMVEPWNGPNVARALSLVMPQGLMFYQLIGSMYGRSNQDFNELEWDAVGLTRPQVELLASRVSSVNECFY